MGSIMRSEHFEHRMIPAGEWQRIRGTTPTGDDCERPHFVATTDRGQSFVALDAFGACGSTGLCPGKVLVDGEWIYAYRFIKLPEDPDQIERMLADLDIAVVGSSTDVHN